MGGATLPLDLDGLDDRLHLGTVVRQRPCKVPALDHHANVIHIEALDMPSVVGALGIEGGRPWEVRLGARADVRRDLQVHVCPGVAARRDVDRRRHIEERMSGEGGREFVGGRSDLDVRQGVALEAGSLNSHPPRRK